MILLLLGIMALLTVGLIVIMAVSVGWWLIPVAILLILFRKCLDALKALFRKKSLKRHRLSPMPGNRRFRTQRCSIIR